MATESFSVKEQSPSTATALSDAPVKGSSQPPLQGQAKINQMAADAQDNTDAAATALSGFAAQMTTVSQTIQKSAAEAAQAQEASSLAGGLAVQKVQKATLDHANVIGTNPEVATFILSQIADQFKKNNAKAQEHADDIAYATDFSNAGKDFFKWAGKFITLDYKKVGQASAEAAADQNLQTYQGLNEMTQTYSRSQLAISQSATAERIAQDAKVAAFNLNQQASNAELQSLQLNSQNVVRALGLQNQPFDIERQRQASANDETRLTMARQQAAKQNILTDFQLSRERRAEARETRMQSKFDEAERLATTAVSLVNAAAAATGIALKFNSVEEIEQASKSPQMKEKIDMLYSIGMQTAYSARTGPDGGLTPTLVISDSPTKTYAFVKGMGAKLGPGQQPLIDLIDTVRTEQTSVGHLNSKMKPQEYQQELDVAVKSSALAQYKKINRDEKNIYAPPPLSTFLSNPEFVAGAPVMASTMKTHFELGVKTVDFDKLTSALTEAAKNGTLPLAQIDNELKFFAEKTMALNNSLRKYDETAGLPRMKNMNVQLTVPVQNYVERAMVGGDKDSILAASVMTAFSSPETVVVDLADDTKRQAYLNKLYARNIPDVLKQQAAKKGAKK